MFSESEQQAVSEKIEQLRKVKTGELSKKQLADLITKRRIDWIEENLEEMLSKYKGLPLLELAHKIVFLEHMKINPQHSKTKRISKNKLKIESYNFCPYLEACKQLGLDINFVCREIGEPSIKEMLKKINPKLKFSRNYKKIRPSATFCEEYIELTE